MSEEQQPEMPEMGDVTDDDKLWALLSLALPIVAIVALLMEDKKNRPFIKHAAVQSLVVAVAAGVISTVLGLIPIVNCIAFLGALGVWVYMIYLGFQAYGGAWVEIPWVTDFAKGQGWL